MATSLVLKLMYKKGRKRVAHILGRSFQITATTLTAAYRLRVILAANYV